MSAPTPPSRPPHAPTARPPLPGPLAPTMRIIAVPPPGPMPDAGRPMILSAGSARGRAFDVAARVGTAVTLLALLVVTGAVLGVLDAPPVTAGAATAGR
jgi:hypothetical protein